MPKGFHYGRTQSRHYTCEYYRIHASSFKKMLTAKLGKYMISIDQLSKEHQIFNLIETKAWGRVAVFNIKRQKIPIPLRVDKRSASNKLYLICPYCRKQRQHLYAATNSYGCRNCLDLKYACQSESSSERVARRIRKLRRVIWGEELIDTDNLFDKCEWYPKPKWRRWNKFNLELKKITILESRYWKLQENFLNKLQVMDMNSEF